MRYFQNRILAFKYALNGVFVFFKEGHHARIHLVMATVVISGGFYFHLSRLEWYVSLLCIAMVISAEMFNSAIENLCDLISPEINPLAGKLKDIAAGGVLVCAIVSALIGLEIFGIKFYEKLNLIIEK